MRTGIAIVLLACAAQGQVRRDPASLPPRLRDFSAQPGEQKLSCSVREIRPELNFSFRFQAGWVVSVPMKQYVGARHRWTVVSRITPEGGTPTYFTNNLRVPVIEKSNSEAQMSGTFLVGEGRYQVEWKLMDDAGRVCHANWKVVAKLSRGESKVKVAIAPGTVTDYVDVRSIAKGADDSKPFRLTVLFHAAPVSLRRIPRMSGRDRVVMLGLLNSLLERLPTSSVRLVVFNLDHQAELLRQDQIGPGSLSRVGQVMNELELGTVDFQTLSNRKGHVDLLADLINRELAEPEQSDVVLFLGPAARFFDKVPDQLVEKSPNPTPGFFYLQYRPPYRRDMVFGDTISSAISRVGGKVKVVHNPGEFAKAIEEIERRATQTAMR